MIRYGVPMLLAFALGCSGGDKGITLEDVAADAEGDVFFPIDVAADTGTVEDADGSAPDDTSGAEVEVDDNPLCGTFGCACNANSDCLDELCIEGQSGFICTKVCSLECPDGFDCLTSTAFGPDPLSLCVPRHVPLCRPCLANSDCTSFGSSRLGHCLPAEDPDEGRFCGTSCDDGVPCPDGYACDTVTVDGGGSVRQCRPTSGLCECRPSWASAPYETTCTLSNDAGRCVGRRGCGPDGLRACAGTAAMAEVCNRADDDCNGVVDDIAGAPCLVTRGADACPGTTACADGVEVCVGPVPAAETCNGADDNCDGMTDEGTCFDGLTCTNDVCVGAECNNALVLGACLIDGVCYEGGQTKPDDLCQTCQPGVSTTSFTLADAILCDDFDPCTSDDTCHTGTCAGTPYVCDDGFACTRDTCDGRGGCSAPLSPNNCFIEGVCYAEGAKRTPTSCEVCDPTSSTHLWSGIDGASCNDNDPCTMDDKCAGTGCRGTPYECDDGDACTIETCDGLGGCNSAVADLRCNIGGVCYAAGTPKPNEPCFRCDPDKSDSTWSPADPGASCDDRDPCTSGDACSSGLCRGTAYTCDDGLACTTDACDGAGGCNVTLAVATCVIEGACIAADTRKIGGGCLGCAPEVSTKEWSPLAGQSCDDGQDCTSADTCVGDVCTGTAYDCNDNNTCTVDRCNGDGTCSNVQAPTSCIINGVCYPAETRKPGEACLACRPELSLAQWSPVAQGTGCDDGKPCTSGDQCSAGICSGTTYSCDDGLVCTSDACDGLGGCSNSVNPGACAINSACFVAGALATLGDCRVCDPSLSSTAWSPRTGQGCNDGTDCTRDDACVGMTCAGTPYTCDDGVACTNDSCDGDGTCTFQLVSGACLIGGVCYPDGAQKAGEPCYACRPEISGSTWSPALVGTECDDGKPCTSEDECSNGLCAGTPYVCNDGLACTNDACDGVGGCTAPIAAGSCLIGGQCIASGTLKTPGGCLWCNPASDPRDWTASSGASCNDGNLCSSNDRCVGSSCQGTAYTCNDGLACTSDSCVGDGTCTFALQNGSCNIGNVCYSENTTKPGDECLACRPSLAQTDWRPVVNNTPCNDGQSCTKSDKCTGGICLGTSYACDDGKPCTTDQCNGDGTCTAPIDLGSCLIAGTCYPDGATLGVGVNACLVCDSEVSQQSWLPNSGAPCNDGVACTSGDLCAGSTCGGVAYSCDDNNACTLDSCRGDGTCNNVQSPTSCTIGGVCYAAGVAKPGEPCFACRPEISTATWSAVAAGAACNDNNACTKNDQCNAGSCAGTAYVCNDGLACTSDSCDGAGGCGVTVNAGSCAISGACYANGALQTVGGCLVCAAAQSPTAWFPNSGATCNDGVACTKNDVCTGSTCGGTSYSCDDALTCTTDSCNGNGTCTNTQVANTCLIAGVCYSANTVKNGDPCLQCRPDLSATTWSPVAGTNVACNDGNACTSADKCNAGSCSGTAYICNDNLACTTDSCNGDGTCSASVNANFCAINNACYANGTTDPGNACRVCNSVANPTGWSNKALNTACNDGNSCTHTDVCNGSGQCAGTGYSCNDGLSCTTDTCTGVVNGCTNTVTVGCKIGNACVSEGADNPSNPCQECNGSVSRTSYSAGNNGAVCNDNASCTHTDRCSNGTCAGTAYACDDGKTCTSNVCNGNNTCSYPIIAGNCLIAGTCYTNNTTAPGNVCLKCATGTSTTSWTNNNIACNDNDVCSNSDFCSAGVCDGTDIVDAWEVNNSRPGRAVTSIDDCAGPVARSLTGTIYGPGDVDFYTYTHSDVTFCSMYPHFTLTNIPAGSDLDLYVYFRCKNGATPLSFSCPVGAKIAGQYGCYSAAGGTNSEAITIDACCTSNIFGNCTDDDSGYIDMEVRRYSGSPTCNQPYTLTWGDD